MNECDECGRVVLPGTLTYANEDGDLCPDCYQKWLRGLPPFQENDFDPPDFYEIPHA